jgi:tRNA A-37 threonylcarbamoyl transferase component Bud32/tetratricopeptide (TPR) repeat protein
MPPADVKTPQPADDPVKQSADFGQATATHPGRTTRTFSSEPAFRAGDLICDRFSIVRLLGRGGMGDVYEADDLQLEERVAVKTIRSDSLRFDPRAMDRLRRELQLARKVTHVNACRLFDFELHRTDTDDEIPFLSMELLRGETLAEYVERKGRLTADEALPLVRQIGAGLSAAHRAGIVHRDFKSANVILVQDSDGSTRAVVTDFGLAQSTGPSGMVASSEFSGTPAYMAPEQVEGKETSAATDIYAFGIVIHEMVTGALPFAGGSPSSVAHKRLVQEPLRPTMSVPDLDKRWEDTVLKCLRVEPHERFATVDAVVEALEANRALGSPRRARRLGLIAVLALAVAAGVHLKREETKEGAGAPVRRRSVAIMGFKNLSGRSDTAWLSTAFAELISAELTATQAVRVVPGETVARARSAIPPLDSDVFAPSTLAGLRDTLDADFVLLGSYLAVSGSEKETVRLVFRVQDTTGGNVVASGSDTDSLANLFELISRTGSSLRRDLGLGTLTPAQAGAATAVRPANAVAVRFYAEGLERMRLFDAVRARELFEQAVAADRQYALAYSALSLALSQLGHDVDARQAAEMGVTLGAALSREERLLAEARYAEAADEPAKAVEAYGRLFVLAPDDVDYGLRLGEAQLRAGRKAGALLTARALEQLERSKRSQHVDPRILLLKGKARVDDDWPGVRALAADARRHAERQHLRYIAAEAAILEATALERLGDRASAEAADEFARRIYSAAGDRVSEAHLLLKSAQARCARWDLAGAETQASEVLRMYQASGNKRGQWHALYTRALVFRRQGRITSGLAAIDEADEIVGTAGLARPNLWESRVLSQAVLRAWLYHDSGQIRAARALLEEALPNGLEQVPPERMGTYVIVLLEQGELAKARAIVEDALKRLKAAGDTRQSWLQALLGQILYAHGELAGARASIEESARGGLANIHLAAVLVEEGDYQGAVDIAAQNVDKHRKSGAVDYELQALAIKIRALVGAERLDDARMASDRALSLIAQGENKPRRWGALIEVARLQSLAGDPTSARRVLLPLLREAERLGYTATRLRAHLALMEAELRAGHDVLSELRELGSQAKELGFGLIARQAEAWVKSPPQAVRGSTVGLRLSTEVPTRGLDPVPYNVRACLG